MWRRNNNMTSYFIDWLVSLLNSISTFAGYLLPNLEEQLWYYSTHNYVAQSAGAAEYTNCIAAEGLDTSSECPRYDTKQSDCEAPVMLELWVMLSTPFTAIAPRSYSGPEL